MPKFMLRYLHLPNKCKNIQIADRYRKLRYSRLALGTPDSETWINKINVMKCHNFLFVCISTDFDEKERSREAAVAVAVKQRTLVSL